MALLDIATRILLEEAAKVVEIADGGPSATSRALTAAAGGAGATAGGILAGPPGAAVGAWLASKLGGGLIGSLTGDSSKKRKMRQAARRVAGRWAELLGRAVLADMNEHGLAQLFRDIAGNAPITRWSDNLGEDLTPLRGVPRGDGQRAAKVYMDAAAPNRAVSVPSDLYSSPAWALMLNAWGGFSATCGRQAAVLATIDRRNGLPEPALGAAALEREFPTQWATVKRSQPNLGQGVPGRAQQGGGDGSTARRVVPTWASAELPQGLRTINPATGAVWAGASWFEMSVPQRVEWLRANNLPIEYAQADGEARYRARTQTKKSTSGGAAVPLALGLLGVAGIGIAVTRNQPKRRGRKRK